MSECWNCVGHCSESIEGHVTSPISGEYLPCARVVCVDDIRLSSLEDFSDYDMANSTLLSNCTCANSGCLFNALPEFIQLKILSHFKPQYLMNKLAFVCWHWYNLCIKPALWTRLGLTLGDTCKLWQIKRVLSGTTMLKCLSIYTDGFGLNHELILGGQLLPRMTSVSKLSLRAVKGFNTEVLNLLLDVCPNVTCMSLELVKEIEDKHVELLSASWSGLLELNFAHCDQLTDLSLQSLATHCASIRKLNIDGLNKVTDLGVEAVMKGFGKHLVELRLDGDELTDLSLWFVSDWALNLTTFTLSFCEQLTDDALSYVKRMPNLTHLHLRKGMDFTADAIIRLFEGGSLHKLKHLNLGECHGVNDLVVDVITKWCGLVETLCLAWCYSITDIGLQFIAQRLTHLVMLDMMGLDQIRGTILDHVPMSYLGKLVVLDVRQSNAIEDEVLSSMVARRKGLYLVNYYGEVISQDINPQMSREQIKDVVMSVINAHEGKCCIPSFPY